MLTNEIENRTTSSLKVYNESFVRRWTYKPAKLLLGFVSTMEHWKGLDLAHALLFSIQRHSAELCLCTHILGEDKYGENLMLQINAKGNTNISGKNYDTEPNVDLSLHKEEGSRYD